MLSLILHIYYRMLRFYSYKKIGKNGQLTKGTAERNLKREYCQMAMYLILVWTILILPLRRRKGHGGYGFII